MGVKNYDAYPEVKSLLGIPICEPIFIMRAQDIISMNAIAEYAKLASLAGCSDEFIKGLAATNLMFAEWRHNNRDSVKLPD